MTKVWTPPPYNRGLALALDPSPLATGYFILRFNKGVVNMADSCGQYLPFGTFSPPEGMRDIRSIRNRAMRRLRNVNKVFRPEIIIVEKVEGVIYAKGYGKDKDKGGGQNFNSTVEMLKLIGAIESLADEHRRPLKFITPVEWKRWWNIRMGKDNPREHQKADAIFIAKQRFNIPRISEGAAEAGLIGCAWLEKYGYSGQLRLL